MSVFLASRARARGVFTVTLPVLSVTVLSAV